jgi:methionyl aminopeptidase
MIICIEPMILTKSNKYYIDQKNNWTVVAKNHRLTCHSEHMVLITENGNEVLTA